MNRKVLSKVLEHCDSLRCEGVWRPLGAVPNCRRRPEDTSSVTRRLANEFSEDILEDYGVVRFDSNDDLQLVPELASGS
jgi:hypothetical protein